MAIADLRAPAKKGGEVQAVSMELGGFEPPTSWVRESHPICRHSADRSKLEQPRKWAGICGDMRGFGHFWREVPEI